MSFSQNTELLQRVDTPKEEIDALHERIVQREERLSMPQTPEA